MRKKKPVTSNEFEEYVNSEVTAGDKIRFNLIDINKSGFLGKKELIKYYTNGVKLISLLELAS